MKFIISIPNINKSLSFVLLKFAPQNNPCVIATKFDNGTRLNSTIAVGKTKA